MPRPLKVFPIGGEAPTDWVEGWNDTHPDTPLQIVAAPDQCQAYLACDLAADVIDEEIQTKHLPDHPVIWPPYVYNSCGDFMREDQTRTITCCARSTGVSRALACSPHCGKPKPPWTTRRASWMRAKVKRMRMNTSLPSGRPDRAVGRRRVHHRRRRVHRHTRGPGAAAGDR